MTIYSRMRRIAQTRNKEKDFGEYQHYVRGSIGSYPIDDIKAHYAKIMGIRSHREPWVKPVFDGEKWIL